MEQPYTNDMRGLAIGISNFKRIREREDFYVDKTGLIEFILDHDDVGVFLFTRPRRFGKSLNLSMIDAFFNIEYKGNRWFEGLEIEKREDLMKKMGTRPVITFSMNALDTSSFELFFQDFREMMFNTFRRFEYLHESERIGGPLRENYLETKVHDFDQSRMKTSVSALCEMLHAHHGVAPIVLVDEYDSPMNYAFGRDAYDEIIGFLRGFYTQTFKENEHLDFAVVTGVMQIAKESIFSGLNNLYVNNVFSEDMGEAFGFTEDDVRELVEESGRPEMMDAVKEWYDGYRFGNRSVYNPWSVLNCISRGYSMKPYWLWEGNPRIILDSVRSIGFKAVESLSNIYNGDELRIKVRNRMTFSEMETTEGLLSAMAASGYLKAVPSGDMYSLSLPNKEVREGLMDQLLACAWGSSYLNEVSEAILSGDPDSLSKRLQESLDRSADVSSLRDELDYGLFALGILDSLKDTHFVRPERGAGKGYADIAIVPRDGRGPSAVLELKRTGKRSSDKTMEEMAEKAVSQIKEKRYFAGLRGDILLYGVAFRQTDVFVRFERMEKQRTG